jgi:Fe-Mn family superoxide dismutase
MQIDRRTALTAAMTAAAAGAMPAAAQTVASTPPQGPVFAPAPAPLPFDPATIPGLSAKLLTSHHDNNYVSAVKRIGAIKGELAKLDMATVPGFMLNGLKREELLAWNSMLLHEIYFSCLGTGGKPGAALGAAIERDFGSFSRWAAEFSAMGKALGGGSGWVLLQWSPHDGRLTNQWANDHTQTLAGGTPILAMDMYEHAYAMDYGAKAAAYVDAFMAAATWTAADARFAKVAG